MAKEFECDGRCALIDKQGNYISPMEKCPGFSWCNGISPDTQKVVAVVNSSSKNKQPKIFKSFQELRQHFFPKQYRKEQARVEVGKIMKEGEENQNEVNL